MDSCGHLFCSFCLENQISDKNFDGKCSISKE